MLPTTLYFRKDKNGNDYQLVEGTSNTFQGGNPDDTNTSNNNMIVTSELYLPEIVNYNRQEDPTGVITQHLIRILYDRGNLIYKEKRDIDYEPFGVLHNLYMLLLMKKYRSNCIITAMDEEHPNKIGILVKIKEIFDKDIDTYIFQNVPNVESYQKFANDFKQCYNRGVRTIVFYLTLDITYVNEEHGRMHHMNLLVYHRDQNIFEHFEPHGQFYNDDKDGSKIINEGIQLYIDAANKEVGIDASLIASWDTCPMFQGQGFQSIEGESNIGKDRDLIIEGGYCYMWSMFFAELCLKNQNLLSEDVYHLIMKFVTQNHAEGTHGDVLLNIIRGYTNYVSDKVFEYYNFIFEPLFKGKEFNIKVTDPSVTSIPIYDKTSLIKLIYLAANDWKENYEEFNIKLFTAFKNIIEIEQLRFLDEDTLQNTQTDIRKQEQEVNDDINELYEMILERGILDKIKNNEIPAHLKQKYNSNIRLQEKQERAANLENRLKERLEPILNEKTRQLNLLQQYEDERKELKKKPISFMERLSLKKTKRKKRSDELKSKINELSASTSKIHQQEIEAIEREKNERDEFDKMERQIEADDTEKILKRSYKPTVFRMLHKQEDRLNREAQEEFTAVKGGKLSRPGRRHTIKKRKITANRKGRSRKMRRVSRRR